MLDSNQFSIISLYWEFMRHILRILILFNLDRSLNAIKYSINNSTDWNIINQYLCGTHKWFSVIGSSIILKLHSNSKHIKSFSFYWLTSRIVDECWWNNFLVWVLWWRGIVISCKSTKLHCRLPPPPLQWRRTFRR